MQATQILAEFGAGFPLRSLPPEVTHDANRAVIDWYASVFPGLDTPPVRLLEPALSEDQDQWAARLVLGRRAKTRTACLHATYTHPSSTFHWEKQHVPSRVCL